MEQFKWTESGLKLLSIINEIIAKEGGRHVFAIKIIKEESEYSRIKVSQKRKSDLIHRYKRSVRDARDQLIIKHWHTHSLQEISKIISVKRLGDISKRGYQLGLPDKRSSFIPKGKLKPVTVHYADNSVRYRSVSEASKELNVNSADIFRALKLNYKVRGYRVSE